VDDRSDGAETQTVEYRARIDIHAEWGFAAQLPDPVDQISPAIPIGLHWMIIWPFDAKLAGLPTVMRDAGTLVMFAGTPYAHLHVCGSPWDGNEYHPGDRAVRTLTYARP
jgi:hypothetical protein